MSANVEHLRAMLALHERAAYLAKNSAEKDAARTCAREYRRRIEAATRGTK